QRGAARRPGPQLRCLDPVDAPGGAAGPPGRRPRGVGRRFRRPARSLFSGADPLTAPPRTRRSPMTPTNPYVRPGLTATRRGAPDAALLVDLWLDQFFDRAEVLE